MTKLEAKIKELRAKASPINYSHVAIDTRAGRTLQGDSMALLDKRIIRGYLFVWGLKDMHGTKFIKGCCANSIEQRGPNSSAKYKITFLWQHRQDDPLAIFDVLEEDDYGLYFETKPLDDVPSADRTIKQIRSGTLNQFSGGFDFMWDKMEYDETDDSLVCKEIILMEGSVVTIASQKETYAVRSAEALSELADDTEDFITELPRKYQLQARHLFTRHKSLVDLEPFQQSENTQKKTEPAKRGINYDYLTKNL
jgi:HK97 family phage prohead protease